MCGGGGGGEGGENIGKSMLLVLFMRLYPVLVIVKYYSGFVRNCV